MGLTRTGASTSSSLSIIDPTFHRIDCFSFHLLVFLLQLTHTFVCY